MSKKKFRNKFKNEFKRKKRKVLWIVLIAIGALALMVAVYFLPPVHSRLAWRVSNIRAEIYYFFNPPDQEAFTPEQQAEMDAIVQQTSTAMAPEPTATLQPSLTPTNYVSPTPTITSTPTPTATPIPDQVRLEGTVHEFESFNNCGPATLSMGLSYWGWEGDQAVIGPVVKPNWRDRNVMPYELVDYVESETNFKAILRYGGDLDLMKRLIAAGFPVIIEKGFEEEVADKGWMGHYGLLTAYNDEKGWFLIQDSYVAADYANLYDRVERHWRAFNYLYIVVYPPDRESEVLSILGPDADETVNLQNAAQKALTEIYSLEGRELFFAWYNYGTSLMYLGDYYGSAQAYDQAFAIYSDLSPRPWRMLWYQTGPYFAYYWTGRYQDVINLADKTFDDTSERAIEETWVWRGRARAALGDYDGAASDFRKALEWHPDWWVAESELENLP
jgi:tetratricopeptide (TPR) repeat protein